MQLPATGIGGGGDRTISFYNLHTKEKLTVTYVKNGRHDSAAMKKINHMLRDWRRDEAIRMDPDLIDLVYDVHRELGSKKPITIISGYRSPVTNAKLRRRSSGVAKKSQHMHGKAMDLYFPDVPLKRIRAVALKFQSGGVGYYPTSGQPFVHIDTGRVRHWPRMSRQQLATLFPDGNTLHVPSDGKPLARKVSTSTIAVAATETRRRPVRRQQVASAAPSDPSMPAAFADPARDVITNKRGNFPISLFGDDDEKARGKTKTGEPARDEKPSLLASLIPSGREVLDKLTGRDDFTPPAPALRPERQAEIAVAALENPPAPAPRPAHESAIDTATITASIASAPEPARKTEKTPPPMLLASLGPLAAPETAGSRANTAPAAGNNGMMGLGGFAPALRYAPVPVTPLIAAHSASGPAFAELRAPDQVRISNLCVNPESSLDMSFASDGLRAPHTAGFTGPAVLSLPVHRHPAPLRTASIQF